MAENDVVPEASCRADLTELILHIFGGCADAQTEHDIPLFAPEYIDVSFLWLKEPNAIENTSTNATPEHIVTDSVPEHVVTTISAPGDVTTTEESDRSEDNTRTDDLTQAQNDAAFQRTTTQSHGDQTTTTTDGGGDSDETREFYTAYG